MRRLLMMTAALVLAACEGGDGTRTFVLQHLEPDAALALLGPYMGEDVKVATTKEPPTLRVTAPGDRLVEIERVIEQYDRAAPDVQLRFQIIEADGFTEPDPAIADVQQALGELFRFSGYRLAAEVVAQVKAPGFVQQRAVAGEGQEYMIEAQVTRVIQSDAGHAVELGVSLTSPQGTILSTQLTVPSGQTVVVGSARARAGANTLILVVRPVMR
jgi:hypothetical protein